MRLTLRPTLALHDKEDAEAKVAAAAPPDTTAEGGKPPEDVQAQAAPVEAAVPDPTVSFRHCEIAVMQQDASALASKPEQAHQAHFGAHR